jgi:NitT/TauT family transport system substrate-binding protein
VRIVTIPVVIMTAAALALTGCSAADTDGKQSDPKDVGKLSIGWTPGPAAPQIAVAAKEGYWKQQGLTATTSNFNSGREALQSLLGGGVDVAVLSELPVVTSALVGSRVTVVDTLSSFGGYRIIGRKKAGVTDKLASLKNKKVGATQGTNMHFLADQALDSAGVKATLVNVAPGDVVTALSRGDLDAGVMFESFYPAAKKALGSDYVEIPVSKDIYPGSLVVGVSPQVIKNKPKQVQALVNGLVKASDFIKKNPAAAQQAVSEAMGGTQTAESLRESARSDGTGR